MTTEDQPTPLPVTALSDAPDDRSGVEPVRVMLANAERLAWEAMAEVLRPDSSPATKGPAPPPAD